MKRMKWAVAILVLTALVLGARVPVVARPATQQADDTAMEVIEQFLAAYENYDVEKLLALHTDDAVWTWIDPGKNFPNLGPEGVLIGEGKEAIQAMFDADRGELGFVGYIVFSEVQGDTVTATELWANDYTREIDAPLITQSTYTLRDGKIAAWEWVVSPESSWRMMNTLPTLTANRELMATINEEIWNQGKLDLIDEYYAEDYVRHEAGYPTELAGATGLKLFIENLRTGFPDWSCTVEDMLAEGDEVVVRYLCTGTHTGEWNGLPPTGNAIEFQSIIMHRITDGKVVEDWSEYDSLGWMQQMGFELTPAAATVTAPPMLVKGAHIHSPNGIKVGPDGNLYVASIFEQAILVIDPDSGEILHRLGAEVGVDGPDDLTFGPDGSLYWTDTSRGTVGKLAPDGTTSSQMVAPGVNPIVVAPDGRIFTALDFFGDALYELDPELTAPPRLLAEDLGWLNSFQFGPDGKLYGPLLSKGQIVRINVDADPVTIEPVAEGLAGPVAVKFDSQGQLYTTEPPGIVRVDMETGEVEPVVTVPYGMDNFAFDAQDRLFISLLGEGTIAEAKPDGTLRMLGPMGMVLPGGVAVMPQADGETIFVGDFWMLRGFDAATGKAAGAPTDIMAGTVAADGEHLLLSNWFANSVVVWNPQTQEVVEEYYDFAVPLNALRFQGDLIVAEGGTGSVVRADGADPTQRETIASDLDAPAGLATDGENLWLSDWGAGVVWQLAADGDILPAPVLVAEGLDHPEGMAATPDGRLLVTETGAGRLLAIDLATGDMSTLAEGIGFDTSSPEGQPPTGMMSSVAVGPSGAIYVTADEANAVYRIAPAE